MTTAVRNPTRNSTNGRVKTKNPMSRPNWGSVRPKEVPFHQSSTVCHCWLTADPAKMPSTAGTAMTISRRRGSTASR